MSNDPNIAVLRLWLARSRRAPRGVEREGAPEILKENERAIVQKIEAQLRELGVEPD